MEYLIEQLAGAGYERVAQVATRGQFAIRGGIVDLFSWQAPLPARLEFFGDEIDSLREFDVDTQTSVHALPSVDILLGATEDQSSVVRDYIARDHLTIELEPVMDGGGLRRRARSLPANRNQRRLIEIGPENFSGVLQDCDVGEFAIGDPILIEATRAVFRALESGARTNKSSSTSD
jgi:transcription-repair coupling factor (superfamily II helicase)